MGGFPAADDPDLPAPVLRPHRGDEPGEWAVPELAIRQVGDFPILDEAALPSLVLDQCHSHEFDPRVSQELALEDMLLMPNAKSWPSTRANRMTRTRPGTLRPGRRRSSRR